MNTKIIEKIKNDLINSANNVIEFSTYRDFCNYLKIPFKSSSKYREAQLLDLKLELDFEKIKKSNNSYKYIIKDVMNPLINFDKNQLNDLTQYVILSYLLYQHSPNKLNCIIPKNRFAKFLGYITASYSYFYTYKNELSIKTNIPYYNINEFLDKTNDIYNRYISNAFDKLQKYKFVNVNTIWYGCECEILNNDLNHEEMKNEYGDVINILKSNIKKNHRPLTQIERDSLNDIELEAFLEVLGMNDLPEIDQQNFINDLKNKDISLEAYLKYYGLDQKYYKLKNIKLLKKFNIAYVYQAYDIVYNVDRIKNLCDMIAERFRISDDENSQKVFSVVETFFNSSKQLSLIASQKLLENTKKRHEKEKQKIDELDISDADKKKYKSLINRETVEFKQLIDLLLVPDNNNEYSKKYLDLKKEFIEEQDSEKRDLLEQQMLKHTNKELKNIKKVNDNWNKHHKRPDKPIKMIIDENK